MGARECGSLGTAWRMFLEERLQKSEGGYRGPEAVGSEGPSTYGPLVDQTVLRHVVILSPPLSDDGGLSRTRTGGLVVSACIYQFSLQWDWRV